MIKNAVKKIYLILIFILLYAPILTLMVLSFNSSKTRSKWGALPENGMFRCSRTRIL